FESLRSSLLFEHDLFRKSVPTPASSAGQAFSGSCSSKNASALHAPSANSHRLDVAKDEVFYGQADQDDREQSGEYGGDVEHVLVLENVPAETALAGGNAEDKLGGNQRAPRKCPADLQAGED